MRQFWLVGVVAVILAVGAGQASAVPVTYNLAYQGYYGEDYMSATLVPGLTASGYVTFDDSLLSSAHWGTIQRFYADTDAYISDYFTAFSLTVSGMAAAPTTETITLADIGSIIVQLSSTGVFPPGSDPWDEETDFNIFEVDLNHFYTGIIYNTIGIDAPVGIDSVGPSQMPISEYLVLTGFTPANGQAVVPEPATLGLLGLGFAGMGLIRRRRKG